MNSLEKLKVICNALDDKKAIDLKVLDIQEISVLADYFVIAGGSNKSQVQALVDNVQEELGKQGCYAKSVEGYRSANWILQDFEDVIVHVFNQEDRLFYDLERIWRDGKEIDFTTL